MHRLRRIPAARKNEKTDEEVEQRGQPQVIFNLEGVVLRRSNQRHFKGFAPAANLIFHLCPRTGAKDQLRDVHGAMDGSGANRFDVVALLDSSPVAGCAGRHMPGHDPGRGVDPGYSVIGNDVAGALLEIQDSKNHRRDRE